MSTMLDALEMKIEKQEHGLMVVSMPVTDKVKQPFGYLHGGASLALGETACSMGAAYIIDTIVYGVRYSGYTRTVLVFSFPKRILSNIFI